MVDPLTSVVALLQPQMANFSIVTGAGRWGIARCEFGEPVYGILLEGRTRLWTEGAEPLELIAGDFVLIPSMPKFTMTSMDPPTDDQIKFEPVRLPDGELRNGSLTAAPDVRLLIGFCKSGSANTALLLSLLPTQIHVRGDPRLSALVQLVIDEAQVQRPAREFVLEKLLELLFVEALRSSKSAVSAPGLLRGLADSRLAAALRCMHESPHASWTMARLAKESALSRSTFFERFTSAVGVAPMAYLLTWRMILAKSLLQKKLSISAVAARVGYSSASAFTVAFTRHYGQPPGKYAASVTAS
jgi:AraC-like DNA-binding protein